ncbi:MAG TPA: ABC transporter ATP-binding protein [Chitinivibrionales bacterium]|nr:ABC transporter ATP-binding protein [Chitinivibrionales bacterium]
MPQPDSAVSTKKAAVFLLSYLKKHAWSVAAGIALLVMVDLIQLVIPRIVQKTVDLLGEEHFSRGGILTNAMTIAALAGCMVVIRFFWRLCIMRPARKIETRMREDMFGRLLGLSFSYFNKTKTGDLMALLVNDLNAVRMAAGLGVIGLTDAAFMGTMSLVFMMAINVKLTLLTVAPLPVIVFVMLRFGAVIQTRFADVQASFGDISSRTQEAFSGIRVIKGFVQEGKELDGFVKECDGYVAKNIRLVRLFGFFFPMITFLASLSVSLLYFFGGRYVIESRITLGQFVSFAFYIGLFVWPMMAVGWVFNMFQRGIASAKRVIALMDARPDVEVKSGAPGAGVTKGNIEARGLTFRYTPDGRDVLKNVSLTVPAGSSLGIMGKPGSGKTTLISLLFHLFPLGRERIIIDGYDINDIPLDSLRRSIGYVPQDSFLFSDTVENNIAFGMAEGAASRPAVERVARQSAVYDEMLNLNNGFSTTIGERGVTLSGGQKQRLAISRALLVNPKILVLDDALSSVDASTERKIFASLSQEIKGRTSLVVAHRVSTVMRCDSIIVLDDGQITEQGSYKELLKRDGFYARLYRLQKLEEKIIDK